jgi:hypothetical protein
MRDLPQPPTNTQLLWVGERELVIVVALTRCRRPAEHHAQIKLSRTARRLAPARCSDVEAKGGGEISAAPSRTAMLLLCQLRTREVDD